MFIATGVYESAELRRSAMLVSLLTERRWFVGCVCQAATDQSADRSAHSKD
jgi:hypothetical protein